jgi:hypothetical protein
MSYIGFSTCRHAVAALKAAVLPEPQRKFQGITWQDKRFDFFEYYGKNLEGVQAIGRTSRGDQRYVVNAAYRSDGSYRVSARALQGWVWHGVSLQSTDEKTLLHKWRESTSVQESAWVSLSEANIHQIRLDLKQTEITTTDLCEVTREDLHLDWRGKEIARALAATFAQPADIVTGARILLPKRLEPNGHYFKDPASALQLLGGLAVSPLNCAGPVSDQKLLAFPSTYADPSLRRDALMDG